MKTFIKISDASIYQGNVVVLRNVNLNFQEGEFVYIIGKSGGGKSSLLKTLYGELPLKTGSIMINDFQLYRISRNNLQRLRREMGIIFQGNNLLFDRTIYENLRFVLQVTNWRDGEAMDDRIDTVLRLVALEGQGHKMIYELSGGEQQRVNIARAILNNPKIIIADEPTANLDPENTEEIFRLLAKISYQYKTLVIMGTHEYNLVERYKGRIIKIEANSVSSN